MIRKIPSLISRKAVRCADSQEDVRRERTRSRLTAAVMQIARSGEINVTPVSTVARHAGIYRTTFYSHAETPMEFLTKVLREDLNKIRHKALTNGNVTHELSRELLGNLVDHVIKHQDIYASRDRASSTFALRTVLVDQLQEGFGLILSKGLATPPSTRPEDVAMYCGFFAHGACGAIEAWLRLPEPRHTDSLLKALEAAYPPWFAPAMTQQSPSLGETGSIEDSKPAQSERRKP